MPLTKEQIDKYVDSGGVNCPYCDSSEIEGRSFDMESGIVTQEISCLACGKDWIDVYRLFDVVDTVK
jgi:transposase-like protein